MPRLSLLLGLGLGLPLLANATISLDDGFRAAARAVMAAQDIPGLAVGVTAPGLRPLYYFGTADRRSGQPVDAATLFEIGSLTKTYTATLGGYAAATGRLRLDETAQQVRPALAGSAIGQTRLLQLATYSADGLPLQFPNSVITEETYGIKTIEGDLLAFVEVNLHPGRLPAPLAKRLDATQQGYYHRGPMTQGLAWKAYAYPLPKVQLLAGNTSAMALEPHPLDCQRPLAQQDWLHQWLQRLCAVYPDAPARPGDPGQPQLPECRTDRGGLAALAAARWRDAVRERVVAAMALHPCGRATDRRRLG